MATFHFVFAGLFLLGHIWHAIRARAAAAGFDFSKGDTLVTFAGNPQIGNFETPLNSSDFSLWLLKYLPIYRPGLSPLFRGLEIGMAHGYLLFGSFALLDPQRNTEQANLIGLLSACGLVIILTACLSIYGTVSFKKQFDPKRLTYATANPIVPESLKTSDGWSQFAGAFFVGGMGGAFFAYLIYDNLDVLQAIFRGTIY